MYDAARLIALSIVEFVMSFFPYAAFNGPKTREERLAAGTSALIALLLLIGLIAGAILVSIFPIK